MATNLPSCFSIEFLEQLLKFRVNFTLLKYVKSQRSYGFLITKELIFGFQILDLNDHFSASLNSCEYCCLRCYYLEFLTKRNCLYFQPIRLQLRRYCSAWAAEPGRGAVAPTFSSKCNVKHKTAVFSIPYPLCNFSLTTGTQPPHHHQKYCSAAIVVGTSGTESCEGCLYRLNSSTYLHN